MKFLKNFQILMKRQMEKTSDLGSPAALVLIFLHRWVWVHAETIMSDTKRDPNEAHVFQPPRTSWNTLKCSSKYHKTYLEDFAVLLLNIKTSKFQTGNIRTILHHITFFFWPIQEPALETQISLRKFPNGFSWKLLPNSKKKY